MWSLIQRWERHLVSIEHRGADRGPDPRRDRSHIGVVEVRQERVRPPRVGIHIGIYEHDERSTISHGPANTLVSGGSRACGSVPTDHLDPGGSRDGLVGSVINDNGGAAITEQRSNGCDVGLGVHRHNDVGLALPCLWFRVDDPGIEETAGKTPLGE